MANIPVTLTQSSIPRFLQHIKEAGLPSKVTNAYIKSVGYTSSNDSALIPMFKALGFLDNSGAPTETWRQYRDNTKSKAILGQAIMSCYDGLFSIFPDANRKDDEAIANWIRSNTSFAGITVTRAVRTFKTLCNSAEFDGTPIESSIEQQTAIPQSGVPLPTTSIRNNQAGPAVSINIELQIPPTDKPEVYENFFKAMRKHLLDES